MSQLIMFSNYFISQSFARMAHTWKRQALTPRSCVIFSCSCLAAVEHFTHPYPTESRLPWSMTAGNKCGCSWTGSNCSELPLDVELASHSEVRAVTASHWLSSAIPLHAWLFFAALAAASRQAWEEFNNRESRQVYKSNFPCTAFDKSL